MPKHIKNLLVSLVAGAVLLGSSAMVLAITFSPMS